MSGRTSDFKDFKSFLYYIYSYFLYILIKRLLVFGYEDLSYPRDRVANPFNSAILTNVTGLRHEIPTFEFSSLKKSDIPPGSFFFPTRSRRTLIIFKFFFFLIRYSIQIFFFEKQKYEFFTQKEGIFSVKIISFNEYSFQTWIIDTFSSKSSHPDQIVICK